MNNLLSLCVFLYLLVNLTEGHLLRSNERYGTDATNFETFEAYRRRIYSISKRGAIRPKSVDTHSEKLPDILLDMLCTACSKIKDILQRQKCQTRYCSKAYFSRSSAETQRDSIVRRQRDDVRRIESRTWKSYL